MIHASTSATAALVSDNRPIVVVVIPRSLRMRAMTGNAVIDIAAAMNNANGQKVTPAGASRSCSGTATSRPRAIGSRTDSTPIQLAAAICLRAPDGMRNSAPTMNMNSTRPSCDKLLSAPMLLCSNTCACSSGAIAPNTTGPSTMPAEISPITADCPKYRNTRPSTRAVPRMIASCSRSSEWPIRPRPRTAAALRRPPDRSATSARHSHRPADTAARPGRRFREQVCPTTQRSR